MSRSRMPDVPPIEADRDERKAASVAARCVEPDSGTRVIDRFDLARNILRSGKVKQAGAGAERFEGADPDAVSVFFLEGEAHRRKRSAVARFFSPKTVQTSHRPLIERTTDEILSRFRASGRMRLEAISFELSVAVVSSIVGLTGSLQTGQVERVRAMFSSGTADSPKSVWGAATRRVRELLMHYHTARFHYRDVRPAIRARRTSPRDDIISHLLQEGHSEKAILIECVGYAAAGMLTTREFMVMAALYLFERDELRERFLAADEADQTAILEEILRLEPVSPILYRQATDDLQTASGELIPAGTHIVVDLRAVNSDESAAGRCPRSLDADRAKRGTASGSLMSFGDGNHRCPGGSLALEETRVLLDRLFRVPGIRLERQPQIDYRLAPIVSYELRNAVIACDREAG